MQCKTCIYAEFQRTRSGRIKPGLVGRCLMQKELAKLAEESSAPCVRVDAFLRQIRPETSATICSHWKQATHQQRQEGGEGK